MKNYKVSVLGPFAALGIGAGVAVGAATGLMGMWILIGGLAGIGAGLITDAASRRTSDDEPQE